MRSPKSNATGMTRFDNLSAQLSAATRRIQSLEAAVNALQRDMAQLSGFISAAAADYQAKKAGEVDDGSGQA